MTCISSSGFFVINLSVRGEILCPFVVSRSTHESPVRGEPVEPQAPFDKLPSTSSGRTERRTKVFINRELRLLLQELEAVADAAHDELGFLSVRGELVEP